jgi:ABC-2 type transport system ATP-binding protein
MTPAIETRNLTKKYGDVTAVEELSLCVNRGEIYAFLGLNGAGKTTTIRMLLGMVRPTAGDIFVLGNQITSGGRKPWELVGYMVERPYAYAELTVRENLEAVRRLRPGTSKDAVERIIDLLGLKDYAGRRAAILSQGNKQRLGLARALLHNPALLILDEPANGLDPAGIVEIRSLLRGLVMEQGVTIFMSSHILGEVARLIDHGVAGHVGIIHEGRLLQELNIAELERRRQRRLEISGRDIQALKTVLTTAGFAAEAGANGVISLLDDRAIEQPDAVAAMLVNAGQAPTMLKVEQEDLEHYFLRLVGLNAENGR